ncbi:unnamed protein product [Brassicogethes aeneus]|uniref:Uncharacterized protein n=1 Tax=Brassicogethes aeneus TaxID=1431903 RepID=A0A9P0FK87_BRAAE|nr:unnamed protein product [Brassicogethes aeneus]
MDSNFENSCRICANEKTEDLGNLFEINFIDTHLCIEYLRKITDLKYSFDDILPKTICKECLTNLNFSYNFTQQCINSEKLLKTKETQILLQIEQEASKPKEQDLNETCDTLKSNYEEIILTVSPNVKHTDEKYTCIVCSKLFSNKIKLQKHLKTHDDSNPFKCEECLQTFSKKWNFDTHMRSHVKNEDKKYSCEVCGQQFMFQYLLTIHEYKHKEDKPFPCSKCNKSCLTGEHLRRHVKIHEKGYIKKVHSCLVCNKKFSYPSFLEVHMKTHTGEKPHLCSVCGKAFRQIGSLHFHQRVHTGYRPYPCNVCGESFMSSSALTGHSRKHTNEKPFVCDICGVKFGRSGDMKSHQKTHTGEKSYLCTICGKKFTTTGQLTIHVRSHTGEKPFSCTTCLKSFTTSTSLKKHERIHTGERPYVCQVCGKGFTQRGNLTSHLNFHNKTKKTRRKNKSNSKPIGDNCNDLTVLQVVSNGKNVEVEDNVEYTEMMPMPVPTVNL